MTNDQLALWQRIESFLLDSSGPVGLTFASRLALENGWGRDFAERAVLEYKRFVFLALAAGHPVCPSEQVDQVWHLHLTYTRSYWDEFCQGVLSRRLHHDPTRGGAAEAAKHHAMYAATLASYRQVFGSEPPADLWPAPTVRFGEDTDERRVNLRRNWVVPKAPVRRGLAVAGVAAVALGFASGCVAPAVRGNGGIDGQSYLWLYVTVFAGAVALGLFLRNKLRGPDTPVESEPDLNCYDLALLAGGPARVFDTALVRLIDSKQMELTADGTLKWWVPTTPEDLIEAAIAAKVQDGPQGSRPLAEVRKAVKFDLEPNKKRLREHGLFLEDEQANKVAAYPLALVMLVPMLLGLLRIVHAVQNNKPIGFLVVLTIISFVVTSVVFGRVPRRTVRGDLYLKERKARPRVVTRPDGRPELDIILGTALLGTIVLAGTAYAHVRSTLYPKGVESGSASGCSSACGAGCGGGGGGGCGGGGCGGCGGGGD
jgi:uncharacterized protein (TIGR04222 family)